MKSLYGLTQTEAEALVISLGFPKFRAAQILDWLYKKHILDWDEIKNLPKDLLGELEKKYALTALQMEEDATCLGETSSKYLFRTSDGHLLESVLISSQREPVGQRERETVCVSSQLGCPVRCTFCASGKGGFLRNLTAGEIIEQIVWIAKKSGRKITNVVFMGMGEPLENFEEVIKALDILTAQWGFEMGGRKITLSTCGVTDKIYEFVKRTDGKIRLSVSLHAPADETRSKLIPYNRKYPLPGLLAELKKVHQVLKRDITFEYTLIAGVNDSREDAKAVAGIAKPLRAKLNLIPYNPIREIAWETPSRERMMLFRETLEKSGVRSTFRKSAGLDAEAACGQLRLDRSMRQV
ncbi:MAG: putative dual-specificity RNA methyltransferase RlmN [Candidatus Omnitrophica bacterium ADurb.Bin277]|nr:MAG: putative dual-specificity RNA methyltransferase RlmN [Candidatus Omnitrophica bacterium ADurb.Bin277]